MGVIGGNLLQRGTLSTQSGLVSSCLVTNVFVFLGLKFRCKLLL